MTTIALIPARGGSKGIPRKNIKLFNSKPLIYWSIKAALNSRFIDRVIVSTEDKEIAEIASSYSAEVPFMRPANFSRDDSSGIDPVIHALEELPNVNNVLLMQPTSPLRKKQDLKNALKIFIKEKADSLVSVSKSLEHPSDSIFLNKNFVKYFLKNSSNLRQSYKKSFFINGSIYIFNRALLKSKKIISNNRNSLYLMPKIRSIDINDKEDLEIAKKLI